MPKYTVILSLTLGFLIALSGCKKSPAIDTPVPVSPVTPVVTTPLLSSMSPSKALPNSAVSIIGTNFSSDLTKISVSFNGINATVYSATANEIVVGVPALAKTGKVVLVTDGITLTSSADFTVTTGTQSTFASGYFEHIAIDASGNIFGDGYPLNSGNQSVNKITSTGVFSVLAGGLPYNTSLFKQLWGTAVDAAGNIYVADEIKHIVYKIISDGTTSVFAGSGTSAYADGTGAAASFVSGPLGLAIDASGNLYTNDKYRVRKITPAGVVSTIVGGDTKGYVDGDKNSALLGGGDGIIVDAGGNVYIADNRSVRKITPNGTVTTIAGNGTSGFTDGQGKAATFYEPQSMAMDATGNIFVADNQYSGSAYIYSIRMVNKAGFVSTFIKNTIPIAVGSFTGGIVNGVIGTATANDPDGIAFDNNGNMYIANKGAYTNNTYGVISMITFR